MQSCWPQPGVGLGGRTRFCKGPASPIPACTSGSFGEDCAKKCQCHNGATCDPVRGTCACPPGFTGDICMQGKLEGPLTQPRGSPAQGCFCISSAQHTTGPILAVQREALPPRPPPLSSWLLPVECPLGWYGPDCQSPCKCEHQCPCDPQTGNCSLAWSRTLNSILSRGTAPPRLPGDSRGQTPPLPTFSLSLASCSEAVSPATRGHPAGRRTLPFHQVGTLLGAGAGVGGIPPPSAFEAWPPLRVWAGLGTGSWAPDDNSLT